VFRDAPSIRLIAAIGMPSAFCSGVIVLGQIPAYIRATGEASMTRSVPIQASQDGIMIAWRVVGVCAHPRAMADGNVQQTKRCASCGGKYFLEFFRPSNSEERLSANSARSRRDRCIGCETRVKREEQAHRRLRRKAADAMSRHAERLKQRGVIEDQADLEELYGWSLDQMVEDIIRMLKEGCAYCLQKIDRTEQGVHVVTLEIFDPLKPPHYSTNVRWCCASCNSERQRISPDIWGARLSMWIRWRRHQIRVEENPETYGFLALNKKNEQSQLF
jgi:hypothetical protein